MRVTACAAGRLQGTALTAPERPPSCARAAIERGTRSTAVANANCAARGALPVRVTACAAGHLQGTALTAPERPPSCACDSSRNMQRARHSCAPRCGADQRSCARLRTCTAVASAVQRSGLRCPEAPGRGGRGAAGRGTLPLGCAAAPTQLARRGAYPATALWRLALRHPRRALGAMTTSHSCAPQACKYYALYRS